LSIAEEVSAGRRSARDVCEQALTAIAAKDPRTRAFLDITGEHARQQAERTDQQCANSQCTLAGIPIAIKDTICTAFGRTTCGSRMLGDYRSPFDATAVTRIEAAGGVIVGKTNCDEFAMGSSTENSGFHPTHNPWNHDCVPGGSSGGSAAAVAAGMVPLALGSDTGGSVRQPAAFCGVVGLKPTYGRVSRYGLVAYASSLDQIGPIAANVTDAALLLRVIAGPDPLDSTCASRPVDDYVATLADRELSESGKSIRIGVPREYFGEGLDPEVRTAVAAALSTYRSLGATVLDVTMPHTRYGIAAYYVIATAECSSNLARFDGVHFGHRAPETANIVELYSGSRAEAFGPEVKRRIMLGTFALAAGYYDAYYDKALRIRRLVAEDFERAFEAVDVLVCPTTPTPAFRFGEKTADPLQMYLGDAYTVTANLAGVPAISIPCGLSRNGLPIGLQLIGRHFDEARLLQTARLFERQSPFTARPPA
jgi:aspartyl-tRNA(Asn)/glutamyl-tRNA(Gln) amidotransferase subunit A